MLSLICTTVLGAALYDDFSTYNASVWKYDDQSMGTTDGCKVWYLKNHSLVNKKLSLNESGLQMLMSSQPCKTNPAACHGAKMAADHLSTHQSQLYGDYELRMRAPYNIDGDNSNISNGIYAYFTAGYGQQTGGVWNEINFGFHPDRDEGGTKVSCEHHDDTGGYHETSVALGFNYRESFNTYTAQVRKGTLAWLVNGKTIHSVNATLSKPMSTRLILRTNFRQGDPGYMPTASFEVTHYKFTPAEG